MEFVKVALLVMLAAAVVVLPVADAETHYTVGGDSGWKVPDSKDFYSKWASKYKFVVGDVLEFVSGDKATHSVGTVPDKEAYDSCDKSKVLVESNAPLSFVFDTDKTKYIICTIGTHCSLGMKFTATAAPAPPGTIAPPPPTTKTGAAATTQTPVLVGGLLLALGLFQFFQ